MAARSPAVVSHTTSPLCLQSDLLRYLGSRRMQVATDCGLIRFPVIAFDKTTEQTISYTVVAPRSLRAK